MDGKAQLADFLREHVAHEVRTVDKLHLEYAEAEGSQLHPAYFGESDQ